MATWTLNDEREVNSYGFRLPNANADLERFKSNPIMLLMHDLRVVIGRWKNVRVEGPLMLAEDEFDMEDEEAKKIAGKVERGFIKGCSLGLLFPDPESFSKAPDGVWEPSKWEPYEDSIVTVPSSKAALRLYAAPGVPMTEDGVKLSLSAISKKLELPKTSQTKTKNSDMEKFTLTGGALAALLSVGLTDQNDPVAVHAAIATLAANLKTAQENEAAAKTALQTLKDAQLTAAKTRIEAKVDAEITAGKFTADRKESLVKLGLTDESMLDLLISAAPGKTSLSVQAGGNPLGGDALPKTQDEFQKLTHDKQLAFKNDHPSEYKALFG